MRRPDSLASPRSGPARDWRVAVDRALQAAGLRASSARTVVLDWIAAAERPFTAEMIVQQLVVEWGLGSRPTIYRTIDWLRVMGWLARLHIESNDRAYVRSLPGGSQLVCIDCGCIQIITDLEVAPLLAARLQDLGFELQGEHLELYGRCRQCRQADGSDQVAAGAAATSAVPPPALKGV